MWIIIIIVGMIVYGAGILTALLSLEAKLQEDHKEQLLIKDQDIEFNKKVADDYKKLYEDYYNMFNQSQGQVDNLIKMNKELLNERDKAWKN